MTIDVRPLQDLDDARQVAELVYGAYGLTYHRAFLYEPAQLLALNREGKLHSWLAFDAGRVVGHLATIRPWFEIADPGPEPVVLEVGLSVVDAAFQNQHVQSTLALATVLGTSARNPALRGFYMKCVTTHTYSQRSARHFLGKASALFPAGVPAWVRSPTVGPTTTILIHCPYGEHTSRVLHTAPEHAPMLAEIYAGLKLPRELHLVRGAAAPRTATRLRHWFDAPRRQGLVWVREAGPDVVEAVKAEIAWLRGGDMEHITVLMPLDSPWAALTAPMIEDLGLFAGGVIPDLGGVDTLVLEQVVATEEELGHIQVLGDDAERLKKRVLEGWRRSREWAELTRPHRPIVEELAAI